MLTTTVLGVLLVAGAWVIVRLVAPGCRSSAGGLDTIGTVALVLGCATEIAVRLGLVTRSTAVALVLAIALLLVLPLLLGNMPWTWVARSPSGCPGRARSPHLRRRPERGPVGGRRGPPCSSRRPGCSWSATGGWSVRREPLAAGTGNRERRRRRLWERALRVAATSSTRGRRSQPAWPRRTPTRCRRCRGPRRRGRPRAAPRRGAPPRCVGRRQAVSASPGRAAARATTSRPRAPCRAGRAAPVRRPRQGRRARRHRRAGCHSCGSGRLRRPVGRRRRPRPRPSGGRSSACRRRS